MDAAALMRRLAKRLFSETPAAVGIDGYWSDRDTRAEVFEDASQFLEPGAEQARRGGLSSHK
jgi:hypothetical protein